MGDNEDDEEERIARAHWAVVLSMALLAAVLLVFVPFEAGAILEAPAFVWLAFIPLFYLSERYALHFYFSGDTSSESMIDIPFVVGLFLLRPHHLLAGFLVGNALAFAVRRLPPVKVTFNVVWCCLTAAATLMLFHALIPAGEIGPRAWAVVGVSMMVMAIVGSVLIALMMRIASGVWPVGWAKGSLLSFSMISTNVCVGLLIVVLLERAPAALLLSTLPLGLLGFAYKGYLKHHRQHRSLARLHDATEGTLPATSVDDLASIVLRRTSVLLNVPAVDLVLSDDGGRVRWVYRGGEGRDEAFQSEDCPILTGLEHDLVLAGGCLSERPPESRGLSDYLVLQGLASCAAAAIRVDGQLLGYLIAGDTDPHPSERFDEDDLRLLESFASHVALALKNIDLFTRLNDSFLAATNANELLAATMAERERDEVKRRSLEEQLRHAQKMEAVGQLAGGVAHNFNNLLTVVGNYAELVHDGLPENSPMRDDVRQVIASSERGAQLVRQLMTFSRKELQTPDLIDMNEALLEIEKLLRGSLPSIITIRLDLSVEPVPLLIGAGHLDQVLVNLAVNARDAMPAGGLLSISTSMEIRGDERWSSLTVSDNGVGMDPEVRDRAFEPFFTTKDRSSGTGLGLATVYGILEQAGGEIEVVSEPGAGTTFKFSFPPASLPARSLDDERSLDAGYPTVSASTG